MPFINLQNTFLKLVAEIYNHGVFESDELQSSDGKIVSEKIVKKILDPHFSQFIDMVAIARKNEGGVAPILSLESEVIFPWKNEKLKVVVSSDSKFYTRNFEFARKNFHWMIADVKVSALGAFVRAYDGHVGINGEVYLYLFRIYKTLFEDNFFKKCDGESLLFREAIMLGLAIPDLTFVNNLIDKIMHNYKEFSGANISKVINSTEEKDLADLGCHAMLCGPADGSMKGGSIEACKKHLTTLIKLCHMNVSFSKALDPEFKFFTGSSTRYGLTRRYEALGKEVDIPNIQKYLEVVEHLSTLDNNALSLGSISQLQYLLVGGHDDLFITKLMMQFIDLNIQLRVNQSNDCAGPVIRRLPSKILRFCIVYLYGLMKSLLEMLDEKGSVECKALLGEWDQMVTHLNAYNTESGLDDLFKNKKDFINFMGELKLEYKDRFTLKASQDVACANPSRDSLFAVANDHGNGSIRQRPHSR